MTEEEITRRMVACGQIFTQRPIDRRALFAGRLDQIGQLVDAVNSGGRHAILYGDRGVGKTSLVSILKDLYAEHPNVRISRINCEPNDTFASVWDKSLAEIAILEEHSSGNDQFHLNQWLVLTEYVGPGQIRKVLQKGNESIPELVLVFDEFDKLAPEQRASFPHTVKDIADNQVGATIVMVGVANDVNELISEHASISRNLAQIKMPPMALNEIKEIIQRGLGTLDMTMTNEAFATIATLSQGFPHFTHLLCKYSALAAIDKRRKAINAADVQVAIYEALKDNSYNVVNEYQNATMAQRKGTLFEQVLIACALAPVDDLGYFASNDVRPVLNAITQKKYELYSFSQHLDKFSSEAARGPVFEKRGSQRCYRYRFNNPLLRPYSIIKGMADRIVTIDALQRLEKPPKKKPTRKPSLMPTPKKKSGGLFEGH